MLNINEIYRVEKGVIKLWELSARIGISQKEIIRVLEEAGYYLPSNKPSLYLNETQIKIIATKYIASVVQLHKKTGASYKELPSYKLKGLQRFFSMFISNIELLSDEQLYSLKLDLGTIENFFYSLVYHRHDENYDSCIYYAMRMIKLKITRIYSDLRTIIFSMVITNHYHVFPGEEDHNRLENNKRFFSSVKIKIREVINSINLKSFSWNKTYNNLSII